LGSFDAFVRTESGYSLRPASLAGFALLVAGLSREAQTSPTAD
jgi:hypothetical protein